ncbi:methyl-accepting chemotaxis protein [Colwellia sp. MEBiC06753]
MTNHPSVIRKVLLAVAGIISLIAILVAGYITHERASQMEQSVIQEIRISTQTAGNGIHEFFRERSRVVTSLRGNPFINGWFSQYTERGSAIDHDADYQKLVQHFKHESANDPMIKSVFYAPAATHEYFDINGRYNDDNYYTSKRPWWGEALKKDRLFITKPEIDANDKSIVTSIKSTVYDNKQLLGVLGIDILASEIRSRLIDTMKFQGLGFGFLYTSDGQIISFPDQQGKIDMSQLPKLNEVDRQYQDAAGFNQLMNATTGLQEIITHVTWQGQDYLALVSPIEDETMALDWRIGFMVPQHVIDDPVNNTIISSIFLVIFIVLLTSGVTVYAIKKLLTNPLKKIVKAMDDIATGEGDLTQRIHLDRDDELGQLSNSFNQFVTNIQTMITQCNTTTNQVLTGANSVNNLISSFTGNVDQQKGYIEQIATTANEMTQTIHGISDNAQTALDYAKQASNESAEGQELVNHATDIMTELSEEVANAATVVEDLHTNSQSITSVLEVIKNIAEQTNLLALNAAIEAARAGEQGRGFAVVADEVRSLASRTQESTGDIENIIAQLHASATDAVKAMHVGKGKTDEGVSLIHQVNDKLIHINQAISLITEQSNETASTTREQASASDEITQQTIAVNELANTTVAQTHEMATLSNNQRTITQELDRTIAQFKV